MEIELLDSLTSLFLDWRPEGALLEAAVSSLRILSRLLPLVGGVRLLAATDGGDAGMFAEALLMVVGGEARCVPRP